MVDIHTHYDVEVLDGPSLSESLRHGVTTIMLGSCSLSTVHVDGTDAGDLFGRVEAIPREYVIGAVDKHKTWRNCREYVAAFESLPLGPNLAAFIGHSDMRAATMGLDRATRKEVASDEGRTGPHGGDAQRSAGCRLRRHVLAAVAVRQARRRHLPVPHVAVDVRQTARTAPTQVDAAADGPNSAVGPRRLPPARMSARRLSSRSASSASR